MGLIPYRTGTVPKIPDTENVENSIPNTEQIRSIWYMFGTGIDTGISVLVLYPSRFYTLQPSKHNYSKILTKNIYRKLKTTYEFVNYIILDHSCMQYIL